METPSVPPSLTAAGRSRRRLFVNRGAEVVGIVAALLAVAVLCVMVESVFARGYHALNLNLFTKGPATFGQSGGGIAPAFVGTILLMLIATAIALPVGVLVALYVSEFASRRVAEQARLWLDVLNGFPAIVVGIFVFALLVVGHGQSGYAGSFALAILMLPVVARTTMEMLALVPNHLREASYALGVSKWRTVLGVVLPSAAGGILTGTILAVARAAGETAPLLFVSSIAANIVSWNPRSALASVPVTIFQYSEAPDPALHEQAWAAAFVLIMAILVLSLSARLLHDRSRKRLGQIQ
jgi:phosphate transport system permease protein